MNLELPTIDFETYSEAGYVWNEESQTWDCLPGASQNKKGLKIVGATAYAEHPSTKVLCLYYNMRDGNGEQCWLPSMRPPQVLLEYVEAGGLIEAWNVGFEYVIWNKVCQRRGDWVPLKLKQLRCAMAKARAFGYPGKLEVAGPAMHLTEQKDEEGTRLIRKFSQPRNPTKSDPRRRIRPTKNPTQVIAGIAQFQASGKKVSAKKRKQLERILADAQDTLALYNYCGQDVRTEVEASEKTPDLEGEELLFWQYDRAMNVRGVAVDLEGVENCIALIQQAHHKYNTELYLLTGGAVTKASELAKLADWVLSRGVYTSSLDEEHITELLEQATLPADVRRALEIRQAVGSAAVKKVFAMKNMAASDGRLHELFSYHAAHTGRITGNGPQPTNMPNSGPAVRHCLDCGEYYHTKRTCPLCGGTGAEEEWGPEAAEFALGVIASRDLSYVESYFSDAMAVVSGCLRALFIAPPGKNLICSDYSAIEAVVAAMLTGEEWRIEVFRTHGKIYEASAAKITGVPFEEFMLHYGYTKEDLAKPEWWLHDPKGKHHPLRKKIGKFAELASGYGGWLGAWKKFGAGEYLTDNEIKKAILAWRAASPSFPAMWGGQEREDEDGDKQRCLFGLEGAAISAIQSPGKVFGYKGIWYKMEKDALVCKLPSGRKLFYHDARLTDGKNGKLAIRYMGYNTNPLKGKMGWVSLELYGGLLFENVVQAISRDILRYAIIQLERKGYKIVLQVYDELVAEIAKGFGSLAEFEAIMSMMPEWAKDWPVKAKGGFIAKRYRK